MPIKPPEEGESERAFMSRCMRELKDSDTPREQDQMVAICLRIWRGEKAEDIAELAPEVRAKERKLRAWLHEGVEFAEE